MMNSISEESWNFSYNNLPGEFVFKLNNKEMLISSGVELGILQEKYGFEEKCRLHQSDKNNTYWVETETKHPFGAEPVIKHKYEQCSNHIRVTTDIQISHQLPMENIVIDKLLIPGEWTKVSAFIFEDGDYCNLKKIDMNLENSVVFDSQIIPLILLFEDKEENRLEIGCGYDLWRWNIASRFDAEAKFILKKTEEGYEFSRTVAFWKEEYNMERRNFRFSWYFAWSGKNFSEVLSCDHNPVKLIYKNSKLETNSTNIDNAGFYIDDCNSPDNMKKSNSNEICYCSNAFNNSLKHWLRSIYNFYQDHEKVIKIFGLKPGICSDSAHVSAKAKNMQFHFDYLYLLGVYEWAKQFFGLTEVSLQMHLDKESIFYDLPSAEGMRK